MNIKQLESTLRAVTDNYDWTLYFFTVKKQNGADIYSYDSDVIRFTNNATLKGYVASLVNAVIKFQVTPLLKIQAYDAINEKHSCDTLTVSDSKIKENFTKFRNSLANAKTGSFKNSYKGYVLDGQPVAGAKGEPITFLRFANPTTKPVTSKIMSFQASKFEDANPSLDEITEVFYRLYLTVDSVLISDVLYNFNHIFERIFGVEKALDRARANAITKIVNAGFISNVDDFESNANGISSRLFVTLNDECIKRTLDSGYRKELGARLNIPVDENSLFLLSDQRHTELLIKHLCRKAVKDADTQELLEVSGATVLKVDKAP